MRSMSSLRGLLSKLRSTDFTVYKGIEEAVRIIDECVSECRPFSLILNLPTGYGKTNLSVLLGHYVELESPCLFERVIHVIPTRFLADDICERAHKIGVKYAVQYMWAEPSVKASYFLNKYVVSTYDSFMLNYYKACVAKIYAEHGPFEVPRYAVLSSLVFFDEYHLFTPGDVPIEESTEKSAARFYRKSWTALTRTLKQLYEASVPVILATATCVRKIQNEILNIALNYAPSEYKVYIVELCKEKKSERKETKGGNRVETIQIIDDEFESRYANINMKTYVGLVERREDFIKTVREIARRHQDRRVLVVCNTVSLAQEVYVRLRDLQDNVVLIHSRFTRADRAEKQKLVQELTNERKPCIIVATQVIEVGVNLDSDVLVSEIAPLTALVQRCGRVARGKKTSEAYVYTILVKDHCRRDSYAGVYRLDVTLRTFDKLSSLKRNTVTIGDLTFKECHVQWKLPYECPQDYMPYTRLAEEVYSEIDLEVDPEYDLLLKSIDESLLVDKPIVNDLLDQICSFIRDDVVVPVYVAQPGVNTYEELHAQFRKGLSLREVMERLIPVELRLVPRLIRNNVLMCDSNTVVAIFEDVESGSLHLLKSDRLYEMLSDINRYRCHLMDYAEHIRVNGERRSYHLLALVVKGDKYDSELGLRLE